ncbi:MAG: ester cyclase [Chloroflexota bacterium]|nr:ester cyclase [Chloroflexota bacterium]
MRRFYEELWSQGNLDAIPELIAEDFVDHHPLPGVPPGREGLAALVVMWRTAFPDMRETVEDLIAKEDKVVGRFTMRGTHSGEFMGIPPTGRRVTMSGIDIVRVAGGKIVEFWYGEHLLELLQQLGAVPDFAASYTPRDEH